MTTKTNLSKTTAPTDGPSQAIFEALTMGDRLSWLMEYREIKQVDLAEKIGLGQSTISNLTTDESRKPSAPTLLKLATVLSCNPQWILDGRGDPFSWAPVTSQSRVELLNLFSAMSDEAQLALLATARAMVKR